MRAVTVSHLWWWRGSDRIGRSNHGVPVSRVAIVPAYDDRWRRTVRDMARGMVVRRSVLRRRVGRRIRRLPVRRVRVGLMVR